jgi:O-antigen ligase
MMIYRITLNAISDYPMLGIGLGSFASIFPIYVPEALSYYYDTAHNDYLQNMLELGIPATMALLVALIWLVALCFRGLRIRRRDALYPALGLAASVLVGLHSMVDFSLQIPAVTITYVFLLGIGVAQSRSSRVNIVKTPSEIAQRVFEKPES